MRNFSDKDLLHPSPAPHFKTLQVFLIGQQIRSTWKILNCGAGEGWRR
jgi:hypothetical protein